MKPKILGGSLLFFLCAILTGCPGSLTQQFISESFPRGPEAYQPVGFKSYKEVEPFLSNYLYFAFKLSANEWRAFYKEFPEYWVDIQQAKKLALFNDYNTGYTAYAFRWSISNKAKTWPAAVVARLESKRVKQGDDLFQTIYALGAPNRIIWDNTHEILLYDDDTAYFISDNRLTRAATCADCCEELSAEERMNKGILASEPGYVLSDIHVLSRLNLSTK